MTSTAYRVLCADSDEALWLARRWELLTASNIPRMLGLVKWAIGEDETAASATDRMISEYAARHEEPLGESAEYGKRVEGAILAWAADVCPELADLHVRADHRLLVSERWPWLGCTLDARGNDVMRSDLDEPDTVLEVKDYSSYLAKTWSTCHECKGRCGHEATGLRQPRVPDYVRAQVLVQLAVTGWPHAIVIGCERGRAPRCYEIERDEAQILAVVTEAERVWQRIVALRKEIGT